MSQNGSSSGSGLRALGHALPEEARRNSLLIREVNERISELSGGWPENEPRELLCECGDADCIEPIVMTRADFAAARQQPGRYMVTRHHVDKAGISVLTTQGGYSLVEYRPSGSTIVENGARGSGEGISRGPVHRVVLGANESAEE
jgi:hypothetical protein